MWIDVCELVFDKPVANPPKVRFPLKPQFVFHPPPAPHSTLCIAWFIHPSHVRG